MEPFIHTRYITRSPNICDGKPTIVDTRIRVSQIALEYARLGWKPDEIVDAHPHLTLTQVHAALSYYYENLPLFQKEFVEDRASIEEIRQQYSAKTALIYAH